MLNNSNTILMIIQGMSLTAVLIGDEVFGRDIRDITDSLVEPSIQLLSNIVRKASVVHWLRDWPQNMA